VIHVHWLEKIRKIAKMMRENDIEEIFIKGPFLRLLLRRTKSISKQNQQDKLEKKEKIVFSPEVGIFYLNNPEKEDSKPVVKEGMRIEAGQILGWIEALKIIKPLKSEISGTIKKIVVKNKTPVDYGKPLFIIALD